MLFLVCVCVCVCVLLAAKDQVQATEQTKETPFKFITDTYFDVPRNTLRCVLWQIGNLKTGTRET